MSLPDLSRWGKRSWKQRDGTKISWSEMTVQHLLNAAALIERRCSEEESALWQASCMAQGDMASMYLDHSIDALHERQAPALATAQSMRLYADWKLTDEIRRLGT